MSVYEGGRGKWDVEKPLSPPRNILGRPLIVQGASATPDILLESESAKNHINP